MQDKHMTVGALRRALEGLPDDLPVRVKSEAMVDGNPDTLNATAVSAGFLKGNPEIRGIGAMYGPPPYDSFTIYADGVPEGTCRDCGEEDGEHSRWCGENALDNDEEDEEEDE